MSLKNRDEHKRWRNKTVQRAVGIRRFDSERRSGEVSESGHGVQTI